VSDDAEALAKAWDEGALVGAAFAIEDWRNPYRREIETEACVVFGEHPRGGHAEAVVRARDDGRWHACSECKSRRKTCNEANACCAECRTTGGWTHTRRRTTTDRQGLASRLREVEALADKWDDDTGGRHVFWAAVPEIRAAIAARKEEDRG
jgi:hypothetical protein